MMKKPFVVGITGGTCSGKSTLSERLKIQLEAYKVKVINMDAYFKRNPPIMTVAPITKVEYKEFNHPDSIFLDKMYEDYNNFIDSGEFDIIIIEGLFTLYLDKIRERLDLKVFVDLKSDERIIRRVKRFMASGESMDSITNRYLDTVRFRHEEFVEPTRWHADIIINGTLNEISTDVLLNYIKSHI